MLKNKNAVIYGGGPISGAVANAFAREGARVFLAGHTEPKLVEIAEKIRGSGGLAETAVVDALDEKAVDAFVDSVAGQVGTVDISFNLISYGDVQKPLMDLSIDDFMQPIVNAMRSHFLTTKAAARHMVQQGSGVILAFGGSGPQTIPGMGGFKIALDALEGHRRQWASELGPHGIRVVTLKTGGVPESIPDSVPEELRDQIVDGLQKMTLMNRTATLSDVGNVAAFVASDLARTMTASDVNISCGAIVD